MQETTKNSETVFCPNRLCGKEVSVLFERCPFCNTPLVKKNKTAEEIIKEHLQKTNNQRKQEEDKLRDVIRKRYCIEGDITEEQYKQLLAIYEQENGNRILPQQNDDSPILKRNKWTIPIILVMFITLITLIPLIINGISDISDENLQKQWDIELYNLQQQDAERRNLQKQMDIEIYNLQKQIDAELQNMNTELQNWETELQNL